MRLDSLAKNVSTRAPSTNSVQIARKPVNVRTMLNVIQQLGLVDVCQVGKAPIVQKENVQTTNSERIAQSLAIVSLKTQRCAILGAEAVNASQDLVA